MNATVIPLPTTRPQNPALHAALAELLQLGLSVARLAARLAEAENAALDALAETAAATAQVLATPADSLGDALRAGRDADASEAARATAIVRVAAITESFEKAARAVRRTVALTARLESGRPFTEIPPPGEPRPAPHRAASQARRPANDAEHPDRPESGNELGPRTDDEILHDIHRDLAAAAANVTHLNQEDRRVGFSPPSPPPTRTAVPDHQPGATPRTPPAPDT